MKIAVVVHNGVRQDARVIKQARTLKSAGHDVRIFGLTPERAEDFDLDGDIPVHLSHRDVSGISGLLSEHALAPSRENKVWASFSEQGRLVFEAVNNSMRPDVVHIHDHVCLTAASKYKAKFSCPIVWDAHEIYEELAGLEDVRRKVNPRIIRENVDFISAFITLNESIADVYSERYQEMPEATLIPNATRFISVPAYDGRLHREANLDVRQQILLFQGGFAEHRGISALLDAAAELDEQWSVVFMGWGKLESLIKERASELDDRPAGRSRVAVVPGAPHSELPLWTAGAALGAIPYEDVGLNHRYCTPNKLWEFPAAGVPIVASDLPEMSARIRGAAMGFTVPAELNSSDIARAVNGLSKDDLLSLRKGAVRFIESDSWEHYEPTLLGLYDSLQPRRRGVRYWLQAFTR